MGRAKFKIRSPIVHISPIKLGDVEKVHDNISKGEIFVDHLSAIFQPIDSVTNALISDTLKGIRPVTFLEVSKEIKYSMK